MENEVILAKFTATTPLIIRSFIVKVPVLSKQQMFTFPAFGSGLYSEDIKAALEGVKLNKWGNLDIDPMTMTSTSLPYVFCGGDVAGTAETAVEAVADGKLAAWSIHKYLQSLHQNDVGIVPKLPKFYTPIDQVDLSVEFSMGQGRGSRCPRKME